MNCTLAVFTGIAVAQKGGATDTLSEYQTKQKSGTVGKLCTLTGAAFTDWVKNEYPEIELLECLYGEYLTNVNDSSCDAFVIDRPIALQLAAQNCDLNLGVGPSTTYGYSRRRSGFHFARRQMSSVRTARAAARSTATRSTTAQPTVDRSAATRSAAARSAAAHSTTARSTTAARYATALAGISLPSPLPPGLPPPCPAAQYISRRLYVDVVGRAHVHQVHVRSMHVHVCA